MAKLVAPTGKISQTEINTQRGKVRYTAGRDGLYKVDNPTHIKAMKSEGFIEESLMKPDSKDAQRGYTCIECGFGSWFRKCSRCGHENNSDIKTDGD